LSIAPNGNPSQSNGALPAVWDQTSDTCHLKQVNGPPIYLPQMDGKPSWPWSL